MFVLGGFALSSELAMAADLSVEAVYSQGGMYLSLEGLGKAINGKVSFGDPNAPLGLQALCLQAGDREWRFPNGGDRIEAIPSKIETLLKRPVLVLAGKHYVPFEEGAAVFGYKVVGGDNPALTHDGKPFALTVRKIDSPHQSHVVENLRPVHETVVATEELRLIRSLYKKEDIVRLPKGTVLLVRRAVAVDGVPSLVVTDCGASLCSYLIAETDLRKWTSPGKLDGTHWQDVNTWFLEQSLETDALRHGPRKKLEKAVCVTVDLCWSLRKMESGLLSALREAGKPGHRAHPVFFVSGRWLEQHPQDMHDLIEIDGDEGAEITWGLHSYVHPKSGGFMNDIEPAKIQEDTLKLERQFLNWGIVPSVYYRFPGLIHDTVRLREILGLDLFPIDCESWMVLVEQKRSGPFGKPVQAGSIILVHGNGNEPDGIPLLERWLKANRDWELAPVSRFMLPEE